MGKAIYFVEAPRAQDVLSARLAFDLTQKQAAAMIHVTIRSWVHYEGGTRTMPAASWELFLLKTKQHPTLRLAKKR